MLDLNAELIPDRAGAGVTLGQSIASVLDATQPEAVEARVGCHVYKFGSVWLFEKEGVISQISVFAGYAGKIAGNVGIGSTVAEVEASLGPVDGDEDDCFEVAAVPGWCFEVENVVVSGEAANWPFARIACICIYAENSLPC